MDSLVTSVLKGNHHEAREQAARLLEAGVPPQSIVVDGLSAAMTQLDSKCSVEDFDLLQIMLAGRCVLQVMDLLYGESSETHSWSKSVAVLGTIDGDVHDLGKNIVKAIFSGAGYQLIDLGAGVSPKRFVEAAIEAQADFILVSSLLTTTLRHIKEIRGMLPAGSRVFVVAGGAAVEQISASDLNVDYATASVFDGLSFCDSKIGM
jgi:dimethylamine corrinoid protein